MNDDPAREVKEDLQEYSNRQSGKKLDIPAVGSRWMHARSGNMYDVIMVANLDATREDYPVTVVYQGKSTGGVWARTLES